MRRSTFGVVGADELGAGGQVDSADVESAIRKLEPLVTEARRARLLEVIARRLATVAVAFDGPYDPHNGAAVMRSCEAFGVQSFHVVERPPVRFAAARSVARGAEKWIDLTCHKGAATLVEWARRNDMPLVAAHPEGEMSPGDLARMPRLIVVLGSERKGIGADLAAACEGRVRIPMQGFAESLNVSVTAAILIHSAVQGRSGDLEEGARRRLYARGLVLSVPHAADVLECSR